MAVLAAVVVLDAAVNVTLPEPVRPVPPEIVTQDAPLVALHPHPDVVVTVTVPLPPVADTVWLVGEIVYEHAPAACVTVKVDPAMVSVPVRTDVVGFAETL